MGTCSLTGVSNVVAENIRFVIITVVAWGNETCEGAASGNRVGKARISALIGFPVGAESNTSLLIESFITTSPDSLLDITDEKTVHLDIGDGFEVDTDGSGSDEVRVLDDDVLGAIDQ